MLRLVAQCSAFVGCCSGRSRSWTRAGVPVIIRISSCPADVAENVVVVRSVIRTAKYCKSTSNVPTIVGKNLLRTERDRVDAGFSLTVIVFLVFCTAQHKARRHRTTNVIAVADIPVSSAIGRDAKDECDLACCK